MKRAYVISIIVVAVILLVGAVFVTRARGSSNPTVLPPTSRVQGLTYGEWLAKWWEYALVLPASQNPLMGSENCAYKRVGNVGLVVADSTQNVPINCEIPNGIMLYLEVLGAECSNIEEPPFYGGNEEELRACVQAFVPQDLKATIDGIEVVDLNKYIFLSPLYEFTSPEDNILEVPAGTVGQSIGSGAYLMLAPLSKGKHTIYLKGTYPDLEYTAEKTFKLTVAN